MDMSEIRKPFWICAFQHLVLVPTVKTPPRATKSLISAFPSRSDRCAFVQEIFFSVTSTGFWSFPPKRKPKYSPARSKKFGAKSWYGKPSKKEAVQLKRLENTESCKESGVFDHSTRK